VSGLAWFVFGTIVGGGGVAFIAKWIVLGRD
jgi:hypothetical protein